AAGGGGEMPPGNGTERAGAGAPAAGGGGEMPPGNGMDLEFTAEQDELRASVRRFLAARAPLAWVRTLEHDARGTTDDVWKEMADLGFTSLLVAEEYGGVGGSLIDAGVVL